MYRCKVYSSLYRRVNAEKDESKWGGYPMKGEGREKVEWKRREGKR